MVKAGKTLRNLLYSGALVLATTFMSGCEPEPDPEIKDTIPPKVNMYSPINGMEYDTKTIPLEYAIEESNFNDAWYSVDNETKKTLPQSGTQNLSLENGQHKLVLGASDLYLNSSKDSVIFSVNEPVEIKDTTSPKISISSPLEDIVYNTNDITFSWNIEEENFKEANYSVDNGTKINLEGKSGTKTINLVNGNHKIVLGANDMYSNASKDSVSFTVNKPTWKYEVNPFVQPNDSTLNWYGSGDVNNDNVVNSQDLTRLDELIAGTYSNPDDKRLNDRADINGNGSVNIEDKQLLENKLNGSMPYLPGEWNKLQTRPEREDWLKKMLAIDSVDKLILSSCLKYSNYLFINFHGIKNQGDIAKFLEEYNYDFSNNGRFNLPVYKMNILQYPEVGHSMNTIVVEGSPSEWNNQCRIEPQTDQINVQLGEGYFPSTDSEIYIRGLPVLTDGILEWYFNYLIKDKIPSFVGTNPEVKIITQR